MLDHYLLILERLKEIINDPNYNKLDREYIIRESFAILKYDIAVPTFVFDQIKKFLIEYTLKDRCSILN
jgi:hypothetical protein